MPIVEELTTVLGLDIDSSDLHKFQGSIAATATKLAGLVGVTFGAARAISFLLDTTNDTAASVKFARAMDLSYDSVQRLEFAAKRTGLEAGSLQGILGSLRTSAQGAFSGLNAGAADAFARLGVDTRTANGELRKSDALLLDIADALVRSDNPALSETIIRQLGLGPEFNLLLRLGSDGIRALGNEAARTGAIMSDESAKKAEKYREQLDALNKSVRVLAFETGAPFVEWLTAANEGVAAFLQSDTGQSLGDGLGSIATALGQISEGSVQLLGRLSDALVAMGIDVDTQALIIIGAALVTFGGPLTATTGLIIAFLAAAEDLEKFLQGDENTFLGNVVSPDPADFGPGRSSAIALTEGAARTYFLDLLNFGGSGGFQAKPTQAQIQAVRGGMQAKADIKVEVVAGTNDTELARKVQQASEDGVRSVMDEFISRYTK